jgi:hypothetical protein
MRSNPAGASSTDKIVKKITYLVKDSKQDCSRLSEDEREVYEIVLQRGHADLSYLRTKSNAAKESILNILASLIAKEYLETEEEFVTAGREPVEEWIDLRGPRRNAGRISFDCRQPCKKTGGNHSFSVGRTTVPWKRTNLLNRQKHPPQFSETSGILIDRFRNSEERRSVAMISPIPWRTPAPRTTIRFPF